MIGAATKFEYYDCTKNQWILECGRYKWFAGPNVINIASSYRCKIFEKIDMRETIYHLIMYLEQT